MRIRVFLAVLLLGAALPTSALAQESPESIVVNGLTVYADPGMEPLAQEKALEAVVAAMATVPLSFDGLPDVTVELIKGADSIGSWSWVGGAFRIELRLYKPITETDVTTLLFTLRHELFHHFLETGGVTIEQKAALFELSHRVPPNGTATFYSNLPPLPRYWPNGGRYDLGSKFWLGGPYKRSAGEDFAYLLEEMYDGVNDGFNFARPNIDGRERVVAKATRAILNTDP